MRRFPLSVVAVFAVATLSAAAVVFAPAFRPASGAVDAGSLDAGSVGTAATVQIAPDARSNRWGGSYFPNVPVVTQDGRTANFYDDMIKGRLVVISFIFTSCTDICPLTTARMAQVEEKLGDLVGRDIFFISMTVDPETDTPERLKAFADAFDAGPGWQFLTGQPEDVKAINYKLGDRSQKNLSEHRNEIVLGNDTTGEWARDSVFGDIDRLVMTIRAMDPRWRDQVRVPGTSQVSNAGIAMSDQPGQALFKKICAPCHTIGVGDRVGPDLRGVSARRDRAWLASFIRNPKTKHAAKDPIALALAARFPGVRMPALGISDVDAVDLIAYLDTETARITDSVQSDAPSSTRHQHHH
jgi:cytochrome oxidase Cu insertion factor (SCO1/SenC/PrrC family)/cytochrome c2